MTGSATDTVTTGIMVQSGKSGDITGAGNVLVAWGSISGIFLGLTVSGITPATREFIRFQMVSLVI